MVEDKKQEEGLQKYLDILTLAFLNRNQFLLVILIFALILRVPFLSDEADLIDEHERIFWSESDEGLENISLRDYHPKYFYLFANSMYHLFSESILLMRLFFLCFGMINIFLIYDIARRFGVERIAGFLASINFFSILFSIHISPYIILSALTLMTIWCLLKFSDKKENALYLVPIGIMWGIGIDLHYYFGLLILPQLILVAYFSKIKQKMLWAFIPIGIAIILFLPSLNLLIDQIQHSQQTDYLKTSILYMIWTLTFFYFPHAFSVDFINSNNAALLISIPVFLIYSLFLLAFLYEFIIKNKLYKNFITKVKQLDNALLMVIVSFAGFILLNILIAIPQIIAFHARYLSIIFPLYIIIISIGVTKIKSLKWKALLFILLFILALSGIVLGYTIYPPGGKVLM